MGLIRDSIIFIVGGAVGAGATVLILRKKYDEKYNKLLKDAVDSDAEFKLKEAEKKLAEAKALESGYIQSSGEEKPEENKDSGKPESNNGGNGNNGGNRAIINKPYVDYTSYYTSKAESEYPRDEYTDGVREAYYEGMKANDERNSGKPPKIVSKGEYDSEEFEHHDKVTLYYYSEDQVLATEDDEVIEDPRLQIGDALDKYGFRNNDEEAIYVRNYSLMTDYVIEKLDYAYADR